MEEKSLEYYLKTITEKLDESVETSKILIQRILNIMKFLIPIIAALIYYLINELIKTESNIILSLLSMITIIPLITAIVFLYLGYGLYTIHTKGTNPENLDYPNQLIYEEIIKIEIEDYILRFKYNQWINNKIENKLTIAFKIILITGSVVIFLLYLYFLHLLFQGH